MCGIMVWGGKSPKQFNKGKFDILGMFNEARGIHSCGVARDGEIIIGLDKNKLYKDFLANVNYTTPKKVPSVIGHTRQSTVGAHNAFNAHPFGFGKLDGNYEFIGVHNGTLINYGSLANKYKIEETAVHVTKTGRKFTRTKIDSEIILEILYKTGNFKVLSEYIGAAALVWTDLKEPNVVYYYHGKSRKRDVDADPEEERPLCYYKNGPNSLYVSSMLQSLVAIGAGSKKDDWEIFEYNTVYKVTDGDIDKAVKTTICRKKMFQTGLPKTVRHNVIGYGAASENPNQHGGHQYSMDAEIEKNRRRIDEEVSSAHNVAHYNKKIELINNNLYFEAPAQNVNLYKSRIYFNKLRYWRNGHKIDGVYTWIPNYGFYYLGETDKYAIERFYSICNKTFLDDEFIDVDKIAKKDFDKAFVPFKHVDGNEYTNPLMFYFYDGIRVKSLMDFTACVDMDKKYDKPFAFVQLSHCSAHPILDITKNSKSYANQEIYFDGIPTTDIICPLGSEKIYGIEAGNCVDIVSLDDEGVMMGNEGKGEQTSINKKGIELDADVTLEVVVNNLQDMENAVVDAESNLQDDLLEDDINDMFKEPLRKYPMFIRRLKSFDNPRAKEALEILDKFVKTATKLISIEIKE